MTTLAELALLFLVGPLALALGLIWGRLRPARAEESHRFVLSPRLGLGLLALSCLAYCAVFGTLAVRQHLAFRSHSYDLGIFDQIMWNSAHGRLFLNSLTSDSPIHLGHHLTFTLLALVPLYWLWSDPQMLLLAQTALLSLGAVPIYLSAQKRLSTTAAVLIATCYLLYPALGYVNLFDFHEIALIVPLLALALYFAVEERYFALVACLIPILLTKEDMSFVVIAFGLSLIIFRRKPKLGAGLVLAGLIYLVLALRWIIPSFQQQHMYLYAGYYAYLGSSPGDILLTILSRPQIILKQIFSADHTAFVLRLLAPLAGLPLAGWEAGLIALPSLAYLLVSGDNRTTNVNYQYAAVLIPPLFFALIEGLRRLTTRRPTLRTSLYTALLVLSLASYYLHSRGPLSRNFQPSLFALGGRASQGQALLDQIPPDAAVSAQNDIGPHLSQRGRLYLFPEVFDAEYIVLDRGGDPWPLEIGAGGSYEQAVARLQADPAWRLARDEGEFMLFARQAPPNPVSYAVGDCIELAGFDTAQSAAHLHVQLFWRATCSVPAAYTVFNHLEKTDDPAGHIWAQLDGQPTGGAYPTNTWEPGRLMADEYDIPLPAGLAQGSYTLRIGMYAAPDGARLAVRDGSGKALGDSLELVRLQVAR